MATTYFQKKASFARFALERLYFLPFERSKKVRFAFSPANIGRDIHRHPQVAGADVLNLHWINFGFLSLESIGKLAQLNKPIVWTLHDMWAFTGGCHYSGTCTHYQTHCHECPFLRNPGPKDLSSRIFARKKAIYPKINLTIVTSSEWLAGLARKSALFSRLSVRAIPIPIDTDLYQPLDRAACRQQLQLPSDKKLVLFGAMNTADTRKGFAYLAAALEKLQGHPEIELVIFGKAAPETLDRLPFRVHYLGSIHDPQTLITVYNSADVFVLPSLEDNLPNTVIESLACGTAVAGFAQGGLPEMVDHRQNGYLAAYQSSKDLATGIAWLLFEANPSDLRQNARTKALNSYAEPVVAERYRRLYEEVAK